METADSTCAISARHLMELYHLGRVAQQHGEDNAVSDDAVEAAVAAVEEACTPFRGMMLHDVGPEPDGGDVPGFDKTAGCGCDPTEGPGADEEQLHARVGSV